MSQESVMDYASNFMCPIDKKLLGKAMKDNPDKENLYPTQINSMKELL